MTYDFIKFDGKVFSYLKAENDKYKLKTLKGLKIWLPSTGIKVYVVRTNLFVRKPDPFYYPIRIYQYLFCPWKLFWTAYLLYEILIRSKKVVDFGVNKRLLRFWYLICKFITHITLIPTQMSWVHSTISRSLKAKRETSFCFFFPTFWVGVVWNPLLIVGLVWKVTSSN